MSPRHARPEDQETREDAGPSTLIRPPAGDDGWFDGDDGEYEELRPESSRWRRLGFVLGGLFLFAVLLAVAVGIFVRGRLDPSGAPGDEVRVAIATGSTNSDIARTLEEADVITDAQFFEYYLRFKGEEGFQAGEYLFRENSAAWDALAVLRSEPLPPASISFTVPEGLTIAQYADAIIDDIAGLDPDRIDELLGAGEVPRSTVIPDASSYEGLLFPDTYQVGANPTEDQVLGLMASQFDQVATQVGLVDGAAALGRTPYEIVIIASLIQEEYGIPDDMPKIARVIYNRLDQGEPLGIDATSRYEAELAGRDRNDVDFESDSPYNTRRHAGLPPTPIAAPGRAALEAALHPADGPWLFYVRDPDESRTPPGGHFFTDSASEFEQVKAECEEAGLGCG